MARSLLLRALAQRPVASLAVGYFCVCVLVAVFVTFQAGAPSGLGALVANLILVLPSLAVSWALGRVMERRAPKGQAWWMTRIQGHLAGFIATVTLSAVPLSSVTGELRQQADAAGLPWGPFLAAIIAVIAFVNGLPLGLALAAEAVGRRYEPPPTVLNRRI